ncbi:MAG: CDP-alcohol phosphatidyltransferase family protein [Planctomycetes bacterium]|nr:CDP-alcohol phosphatidyltransferase family protein [Planctomycetota bacterium]
MKLTLANEITILRVLLIAPFVICMLKIHDNWAMRYIALAIFLVMCISDALDGYFARVRKQVTRLGSFLDPMADKLLMACACILLASPRTAVEGYVLPPTIVVLIIGKDLLLLLGFLIIYLITSHIHIVPIFAGKAATVLQLSMVAAVLLAPDIHPHLPLWWYLARFLWWLAAVLAVVTTLVYIRGGIRYIEAFEAQANAKG